MSTGNGGYEAGYRDCACFWGKEPSSLVLGLAHQIGDFSKLQVLDVGCGEGKNASYFARCGAKVTAIDISGRALEHARRDWRSFNSIEWICADIRDFEFGPARYDVVVVYGLYHCLDSADSIEALQYRLSTATAPGGYHVVCCFNSRRQELDEAHPGFQPFLASHEFYCGLYTGWEILAQSDRDLTETHPDKNIKHTHSMTRILARKGGTKWG